MMTPSQLFLRKGILHIVMPDWGGPSDAIHAVTHGMIVVIAYPNNSDGIFAKASRPVVAEIVGGAGFYRRELAGFEG